MSNFPENGVAPVEPRARKPNGDALPLTDLVTEMLFDGAKTVRLTGEGKTTAIGHLKTRLKGFANIRFLDEAGKINNVGDYDLTIYTAPGFCRDSVDLRIARWAKDDCIEYLITKAPSRCKEIMGNLIASDDLWIANGSPRILAKVLDIMIENGAITSTQRAIEEIVDSIPFKTKRHRSKIHMKCLEHAFNNVEFGMETQKYVPGFIDAPTLKLLCYQAVRNIPASRQLIKALEKRKTPPMLGKCWTPDWIKYFAKQLKRCDSPKLIEFLDSLANKKWNQYSANAASVLYQLDSQWRPTRKQELNLEHVQLPELKARELILENSLAIKSNFANADLSFCSLENTNATGSNFSDSNLSNANLRLLVARHANFSGANLRNINGRKCSFIAANLTNTDLRSANLAEAFFHDSDLRNANLSFANIEGTALWNSNLAGASLAGAKLKLAKMRMVDFREVDLDQTRFKGCILTECCFEETHLKNIIFKHCDLQLALFSGSRLDGCSIKGCNLRHAKLGDIVWTNCDLSNTDFSRCQFHYGSTRSGIVGSPYPSHGTRTGFYTDDYDDQHYRRIEDIRKASLQGCDLTGAIVHKADFYLIDLRDAKYDEAQKKHFQSCGAILHD